MSFETLKSIRRQLSAVEEALRARRMRDFVDSLVAVHDLVDIMVTTCLTEQIELTRAQVGRLVELGLVTADLEERLERAMSDASPSESIDLIESVQSDVRAMLEPTGRFLLRTNIFKRGKKTLIPYGPNDTLRDVSRLLRRRYAHQIELHLKSKGADVVIPEAVDILFYGARVWEDPDDALLSEHLKIVDLLLREPNGVLWFPVLPGDSPILRDDEEEEPTRLNDLLENFTLDTDIHQLENDMASLAHRLKHAPQEAVPEEGSVPPARQEDSEKHRTGVASLVRGEGSEREERIPLVGDIISLGRGRENDIQILNDIKVSRFHCRLVREGDTWFVEDNTSSNGTQVNGAAMHRYELKGGEAISIGNTIFRFNQE